MRALALVVLPLASVACTATTSSTGTPSLLPAVVQGRPVIAIHTPDDAVPLTCDPGACAPSELSARNVTLANAGGSMYRLGPSFFTEDQVASASAVSFGDGSTWDVLLTLDPDGTHGLETATRQALREQGQARIATIVDGRVVTAPIVHVVIDSGHIQLSGFTQQEAEHLAAELNA